MRVDIIGGGPAGLFLSMLLRRENIAADVRVYERNPADTTYGWGVVFPEGALTELARVDPTGHAAIVRAGTTWTPVEIRYRGTRRRVNGNSFHGIPRTALLSILRETAAALGVQLHHDHPVTDLSEHAGADLLVGADGVNSVVRRSNEAAFGPRVEHSAYRYAWLGVDRVFHDFTYIFRETEWGLFQGYCYPSGQPWSSMIIYVPAETWARAGLRDATEAEVEALLGRIFADDLDGRRVTARGAPWARFPHLTCERWHHGNTVLIGDAAHTAHWSIGSGTRLAVEDAIALAAELAERPPSLTTALTRYEQARRPAVERFQAAARRSERYFENVERYFHYEPIQFAYQLMARSWRITHADITARDPHFAREFDAWFHARATATRTGVAPSPAFAPVTLGPDTLPNRIATETPLPGAALTITRGPGVWTATGPPQEIPILDLTPRTLDELLASPPYEDLKKLGETTPTVGIALAVGANPDDPATAVALVNELDPDLVLLEPHPDAVVAKGVALGAAAGLVVQTADAVRNQTNRTVIVSGTTQTLNEIDTVVAAGWADLCVLQPGPNPVDIPREEA